MALIMEGVEGKKKETKSRTLSLLYTRVSPAKLLES
jgi:hypothetical protein